MKSPVHILQFLFCASLFQNLAIAQTAPEQLKVGRTESSATAVDKWFQDVPALNFTQKVAHGAIEGIPYVTSSAYFEISGIKGTGYHLFIKDNGQSPNLIVIDFAQPPSFYYGKTITHQFNDYKNQTVIGSDTATGSYDKATNITRSTMKGVGHAFALKFRMDKPDAKGLAPCYIIYRAKQQPLTCVEGYFFAKVL